MTVKTEDLPDQPDEDEQDVNQLKDGKPPSEAGKARQDETQAPPEPRAPRP